MTKDHDRHEMAPPHPGEVLREDILPELDITPRDLARHLDVPERCLTDLLAERLPLTPDLGSRLGIALGQGARYWIGLQAQYDLWQATRSDPVGVRPVVWRRKAKPMIPRSPATPKRAA